MRKTRANEKEVEKNLRKLKEKGEKTTERRQRE